MSYCSRIRRTDYLERNPKWIWSKLEKMTPMKISKCSDFDNDMIDHYWYEPERSIFIEASKLIVTYRKHVYNSSLYVKKEDSTLIYQNIL